MNTQSNFRNTIRWSSLVAVSIASALFLAACGGGYKNKDSGGGNGGMCGGAYGAPCPPTSAGAPSVTLSTIATNVNRTVALTATPVAPNGITRVEFLVDGTVVGMATASPYATNWDTSTIADGAHNVTARVTDAMALTAVSSTAAVTVANNITLTLALNSGEEFPLPISTATGAGQLAVNLVTGAISGNFTLTGMTGNAAHIHDAYAGNAGNIQVAFVANGTIANRWDLPAGSLLTAPQVDRLLAGALYVNVHSVAYPLGEIRSQLKPVTIQVIYAPMSGAQEVPAVAGTQAGVAAVTINTAASTASVHLNSTGVDDGTDAHIHTGAAGVNGNVLFPLTKDTVRMGHWAAEQHAITASDRSAFITSEWYANIHTPANINGALRGQIVVPPSTLTQLQAAIFTPRCSGCHNGVGTALPGVMNLTSTANSYASLVGVASIEQGTLMRVATNNAAGSYVIQKLEGATTISGSRMPLSGGFLDQPTIATVKSWINAGALNN